ncbi:MAG: TrkA family potassium uptake protein [Candidatus Mcinerneyibacterium aminivorans]|uniref:TrkA family potassium uptake protein n=1 Tax=Candidatus Mcinerneyibacterium aminivorans TaxID=2703815 RepID=A0A5D0MI76_9BACT|nr:MAG: TrkA family potassium uptake protein [Candidatus Mcinerneyibacterium aminivorans]
MINEKYLIVGLGRFGQSVLEVLLNSNSKVMVLDKDEEKINKIKDDVQNALILDATNEDVYSKFDLTDFAAAIVTIGEDFETTLLISIMLKQKGMNKVIARASNVIEQKILKKVGADIAVVPEIEIGEKVANNLLSNSVKEAIPLAENDSIIHVKPSEKLVGQTLEEINMRSQFSINVIAIKTKNEKGEENTMIPTSSYKIKEDDILIIVGSNENLDKFADYVIR